MEAIDRVIQRFVKNRVGGVIVIDEKGDMIYEDSRILLSERSERTSCLSCMIPSI